VLVEPSRVNWESSVNNMSRKMYSHGCSHSQNRTGLAWSPGKRCCTLWRWYGWKPSRCKILYNPCLCYTSCPVLSARTCAWASLHCCHNVISTISTPSFTSCAHSREGTSLLQSFVYVLKCLAMWNSGKWILLPLFHRSGPTILITKSAYEMHIGIFVTYKLIRYFDYDRTATRHSRTSVDKAHGRNSVKSQQFSSLH
jgi:hypothetical protein